MLKQILADRLGKRQDLYAWRVYQAPPELKDGAKVCLLHTDGRLGDAVINSVTPHALKSRNPGIEVWMGTVPNYLDYWSSHPDVSKAIVLKPETGKGLGRFTSIRAAAKGYRGFFDVMVAFDPLVQLDTFFLLNVLQPRAVVGFSKAQYRLFDYSLYDSQFEIEKEHITSRIERLLRLFGVESGYGEFEAHLPTSPESDDEAERLVGRSGEEPTILFNTYGGGGPKTFSKESVLRILDMLFKHGETLKVYLNVPEHLASDADFGRTLLDRCGPQVQILGPARDLPHLFSFVRRFDGILTPDTGIGHVGAAMGKPLLCFFHDIGFGPTVWRPYSNDCTAITSTSGTDVNDQDWATVPYAIDHFLDRVERRMGQVAASSGSHGT